MIFLLLWLRLLCFFPDNQRMFWQLTLRSVLCGAANSLTSTTKPFHGGVLKIKDNDPLPLTGGGIRMFGYTSHYPFFWIWYGLKIDYFQAPGPPCSAVSAVSKLRFQQIELEAAFFCSRVEMYNFNIDKMMWTFLSRSFSWLEQLLKTQRTKISDILIHCAPHHFIAPSTIVNTSLNLIVSRGRPRCPTVFVSNGPAFRIMSNTLWLSVWQRGWCSSPSSTSLFRPALPDCLRTDAAC